MRRRVEQNVIVGVLGIITLWFTLFYFTYTHFIRQLLVSKYVSNVVVIVAAVTIVNQPGGKIIADT